MLGPSLGQSSLTRSPYYTESANRSNSRHGVEVQLSGAVKAFASWPPQACFSPWPCLRSHVPRNLRRTKRQVAYSRSHTPDYPSDPLQLAQSLADKSRECLQYQGSGWQQKQQFRHRTIHSTKWSPAGSFAHPGSTEQSASHLAAADTHSSTGAIGTGHQQLQHVYQSQQLHTQQQLQQQPQHLRKGGNWLQRLWPAATSRAGNTLAVNKDVDSSGGRGQLVRSVTTTTASGAAAVTTLSVAAGNPQTGVNDSDASSLWTYSSKRHHAEVTMPQSSGNTHSSRSGSTHSQNAWGLDTSRFVTSSNALSSSGSYSYFKLDAYSSAASVGADLTDQHVVDTSAAEQQQHQLLDAAWLSAMGALSATATTTELAAAASVAAPSSAEDSPGRSQGTSSIDDSHKPAQRPSAASSSSSSAGRSDSDMDWLTAVLSDSTSRLSVHSNVVLTNSLKRLASLRTLGGSTAAVGAAAAAAVDVDGSEGLEGLLENVQSRFGSFQLQHFEEVALQLSQLGCRPDDEWLLAFERSSLRVMPGGSPRLLSRLLLARAKLSGSCSSEWCSQCLKHMAAQPERLTVSSWVNGLKALVKLGQAPDRSFQVIFFRSSAERLDDVSPELLTTLVWSLARLQLPPTYLWWRSLVTATATIEKSFTHSQLASLIHSMSLWAEPGGIAARDVQILVDLLLVEVDVQLALMQPAELTTILWSLGSLKASVKFIVNWEVQANLLVAVQSQLPRLSPGQLSSLCWGLAKLDHDLDEAFAEALLLEIQAQIQGFQDSGLANVMWALAKLKLQPGAAFRQSLWQEWHTRCSSLSIADICTLFWALARLQLQPPTDLLQELLDQSQTQLSSCDASQLANLTWALGRLQANPSSAWLSDFEQASLQVLHSALLPDLVNLARGRSELAQQRVSDGGYVGNPQPASVSWQAAVLRELRTRCRCLGHDMDCLQLVQVLKEMGVEGLSEGAAAAEASFWADVAISEECPVVFQPGCR